MERIEELSRSQLADGPYDDILAPGDYPPELLECQEFRAAVAAARKEGKRVMISPRTEPTRASREWLAPCLGKFRVEVVSTAYASTGGLTYRQLFDALWAGTSLYEGEFFRQLSPLHAGMSFEQLCDETLKTVMRLTSERINRLVGVIRTSYNADYDHYDLNKGMGRPSERRDAAQEELDRRIEIFCRLMTHAKRPPKGKNHG